MTPYVSYGGCGCCDRCPDVEILGKYVMPDGKTLIHVKTIPSRFYGEEKTFWVDPDLHILEGVD